MSNRFDIEPFLKDPGLLVKLCRDVIDQIKSGPDDPNETEKELQLHEITKAINRLEKMGTTVPEAWRAEKMRLVASLGTKTKKLQFLNLLADEFEDLVRGLKEENGHESNPTGPKKPRGKRSRSPKTDERILRENIIKALRTLGGRARVPEVIKKMERQLEGELLPGDKDWIQSTGEFAWQNKAKWERFHMTQDGILRNDSPRGIWELSEGHR